MDNPSHHWVCRYCVMQNGLKGSDLKNWPENPDEEWIARHIESEHHIPVRRDGETDNEAGDRLVREYPEAGGPNCKCPLCVSKRREAHA